MFPTFEDYEHIAMIEKLRGHIPLWMAKNCKNESIKRNFILEDDLKDPDYYKYRNTYFDWPRDSKD